MKSDIQIAKEAVMLPITDIAERLGLQADEVESYGKYKAKIAPSVLDRLADRPDGKLILVTAINPTPAGEGKTTISTGLAQAMAKIEKNAVLALREPSLGPVFGIKGGAAGGGYAQVVPMEEINLHFTGDMHAITAANNLLCAIIDNHMQHGNELQVDQRRLLFKRCMDMNDRALRFVNVGLGGKINGIPREDGFQITVASEIMAILCLASDIHDLKRRFGNILVGYNLSGQPLYARDFGVHGAMAALMKEALKPNLVQTLENTPAIVHGGPFANIAHGCNTVQATKMALKLGDYAITEAGFGSDLGAEKFLDIKCRYAGLKPSCIVLVATIRALKYNGGVKKEELTAENVSALEEGLVNLRVHVENMQQYGVPVVVAINRFATDSEAEIALLAKACDEMDCTIALAEVFANGGDGGVALAKAVVEACEKPADFSVLYPDELSIKEKVLTIAQKIYRAADVQYSTVAQKAIAEITALGLSDLPICVAKTQYSLSDDPQKLGAPKDFTIQVKDVRVSAGAGFIVVLTGDIMTMPGLPKKPAALSIDIDENGEIVGLF